MYASQPSRAAFAQSFRALLVRSDSDQAGDNVCSTPSRDTANEYESRYERPVFEPHDMLRRFLVGSGRSSSLS